MGQKVNPNGMRVGVIREWDSKWFASKKEFSQLVLEDHQIRKTVKKDLFEAGISDVEIERTLGRVKVTIHTGKPGMVIGKGGSGVDALKAKLEKLTKKTVLVNVEEIRNADLDAQLVAERIASDLERRITFRRAMKQAIQRSMRMGAKGIKTAVAGRLGGADIARTEHYAEGTIPLQTLRADISYGFATARTTFGAIGVKVWIYKGEVLPGMKRAEEPKPQRRDDRRRNDRRRNDRPRRDSQSGRGRDNRGGQRSGRSNQNSGNSGRES